MRFRYSTVGTSSAVRTRTQPVCPGRRRTRLPAYNGEHNEVDRSWLSWPERVLSIRFGVGRLPWVMSDELRVRLKPLFLQWQRCFCYPGPKPLSDREVLCGL